MMAERACVQCSSNIASLSPKAMFCSNTCKKRSYRGLVAGKLTEKRCFICCAIFPTSGPRGWKKSTCSDECWRAWDRVKHARTQEFAITTYGPLVPRTCLGCGAHFISFGTRARYCSYPCKVEHYEKSGRRLVYSRTRAAAQHMQEALAAIPAIMSLMAEMVKTDDQ